MTLKHFFSLLLGVLAISGCGISPVLLAADGITPQIAYSDSNKECEEATVMTCDGSGGGEFVTTPEAHGWSPGNTAAENTAAFRAAVAAASAQAGSSSTGRGVVELTPGKVYTVVATNGSTNDQNAAIDMLPNVEIRTAGKPTRSSGKQAVIQWESWAGMTGMHNRAIIKFERTSNAVLGHARR